MDMSEIHELVNQFPRHRNLPLALRREIEIIDPTGHTGVTWSADSEAETENAAKVFERLTKKGYRAFHVKRDGKEGEPMKTFDPQAEKMLFVAPLQAG